MNSLLLYFLPEECSKQCFVRGIKYLNRYLLANGAVALDKLFDNKAEKLYLAQIPSGFELEEFSHQLTLAGFNVDNIQLIYKPQLQRAFRVEKPKSHKFDMGGLVGLGFLTA